MSIPNRYVLDSEVDDNGVPSNIRFFEILKEFSRSLHKQDASGDNGILDHLEVST